MPVEAERLRDLTLELVEIESPTGDTAEVARLYAKRLAEIGMEVEVLDDVFPATPTVIGRLRGTEPGPTVVLNGHLDTVPIPHDAPRIENGSVYGRGSADMKGACAAAAEAVRVLAQEPFRGEVAIVAIGLHEAPGGRGEDLKHLLESGFTADQANGLLRAQRFDVALVDILLAIVMELAANLREKLRIELKDNYFIKRFDEIKQYFLSDIDANALRCWDFVEEGQQKAARAGTDIEQMKGCVPVGRSPQYSLDDGLRLGARIESIAAATSDSSGRSIRASRCRR